METEDKYIVAGISLVLLAVILVLFSPFAIVGAGEKGVVLNWGAVSDRVLGEGLHLIVPVYQSVKKINAKTIKYETDVAAYSSDIQNLETKIALNYHLRGDRVNKIYQEIGDIGAVEDTIINPLIRETVKAAIAKSPAQELIDKRTVLLEEIRANLAEKLEKRGIVFDDVSMVDFRFSDQYEKAVELKQVAQQQALKAENDLKRIKTEAEQRVTQAQAEAEAIKIQTAAITQQGGKDYVQLKAIEQWDGALPKSMVSNATLPFLNIEQ
ncbi:MAG TPA: prohibitin family protein [Candidatus Pacearchaeota archaeon]|jgi:regulator of protease activity HflC (stomatin/prohibitin superfamily)|nr:MAG: prohibitin family protein [Candidatus Yanofskybacteria bacterium]HNR81288.1 prohibitin family protein [Candidatus Pacearchaeota archaeon]